LPEAHVLQQLKEQFMKEDTMGGGTIFKSVTKADVYGIKFLVPTEVVLNRFEEIMIPIFAELKNLTFENVNLRRTRDLLLPKLISGKIEVDNLDIELGGFYHE
jgi:type I restriction enzyme, S subunit